MRRLTFDIETRPHIGASWGKYEQNIIWFEKYGGIISIAWKFSDEKKAHCLALPDFPGYKVGEEDDKQLLIAFSKVAEEADMFIYQNGDAFDLKTINARLVYHRLAPLRPVQTIDTLKLFRKYFRFPANNLDEVCEYLDIGRKLRTDKNLWKDCLNAKLSKEERTKAWKYMMKYNIHDVELTEEVCDVVLPFAHMSTPNYNIYEDTLIRCPNPSCGNTKLQVSKQRMTTTGKKTQFQCQICGRYITGPHQSSHVLRK